MDLSRVRVTVRMISVLTLFQYVDNYKPIERESNSMVPTAGICSTSNYFIIYFDVNQSKFLN